MPRVPTIVEIIVAKVHLLPLRCICVSLDSNDACLQWRLLALVSTLQIHFYIMSCARAATILGSAKSGGGILLFL